MNNIYAILDNFGGYYTVILSILAVIAITLAVFVIISKNPIVSILYLIGLFITIACYLISIGLAYIGISYLLVYVGAVSILFLFIIMLINIRVSELINETKNSIPLVFLVALMFDSGYSIISNDNKSLYIDFLNTEYDKLNFIGFNNDIVNIISYNNWENNLNEFTHITSIGNVMYTNFSIWIILASIILLLAMVGSIVITIKQKNIIKEEKNILDIM